MFIQSFGGVKRIGFSNGSVRVPAIKFHAAPLQRLIVDRNGAKRDRLPDKCAAGHPNSVKVRVSARHQLPADPDLQRRRHPSSFELRRRPLDHDRLRCAGMSDDQVRNRAGRRPAWNCPWPDRLNWARALFLIQALAVGGRGGQIGRMMPPNGPNGSRVVNKNAATEDGRCLSIVALAPSAPSAADVGLSSLGRALQPATDDASAVAFDEP